MPSMTVAKPLEVLKAEIQERNREQDIDRAFSALDDALDMIEAYLLDFQDDDGKLDHLKDEEQEAVRMIENYLDNAQKALKDLGEAL